MTIVDAYTDMLAGWSGTFSLEKDEKLQHRVMLKSDDTDDGPETCRAYLEATPSLPYLGDGYSEGNESDSEFYCNRIDIKRPSGSDLLWECTINYDRLYSKEWGEDENGDPKEDPLEWRDQLEISVAERQFDQEVGYFLGQGEQGVPLVELLDAGTKVQKNTFQVVVNSAGQPFDPPWQGRKGDQVIRLTRNLSAYNQIWPSFYDGVNDKQVKMTNTFYGINFTFPKYTLLCNEIAAQFRFVNNKRFWEVTFEWIYRPDTWVEEILDQGNMVSICDGHPDGAGGKYSPGEGDSNSPAGTPPLRRLKDAKGPSKNDQALIDGLILFDGLGQPLGDASQADQRCATLSPRFMNYLFQHSVSMELLPGISV